jgi:hypothetical protein
MWLQQRTLMSIVVAALTPSPWDVWVEVKSCIALHHLHASSALHPFALHLELYLYYYKAVDVSISMLFKPNA